MSSLGSAWLGLIGRLYEIRDSKPAEKIGKAQRLIAISQGEGVIDTGCRRIGIKYLAQAVVDKDRGECRP